MVTTAHGSKVVLDKRIWRTLLLVTALLGLSAVLPPAASAALERARISWDTATDIDLHAYDDFGNHAYWANEVAIPNSVLSTDNTVGFGPEWFTDNEAAQTRPFRFEVCYFADPNSVGATNVTGTITDASGATRSVSVVLTTEGECKPLGLSARGGDRDADGVVDANDRCPDTPAPGTADGCPPDRDGDGVLDATDRCPDTPAPGTADGCPPRPVANCDTYFVRPGGTLTVLANRGVLKNDTPATGLRAVLKTTTFPRSRINWNAVTGGFTFKPGAKSGFAIITYVARDARGAESRPATVGVGIGKRASCTGNPPATQRKGRRKKKTERYLGATSTRKPINCILNGQSYQCGYISTSYRDRVEIDDSTGKVVTDASIHVPANSSCVQVVFNAGWESYRNLITFIRLDMRWVGTAVSKGDTGSNWWGFSFGDQNYNPLDPGSDKRGILAYHIDRQERSSFCRDSDSIIMAVYGGIKSVKRQQNATVVFGSGYKVQVFAGSDTKKF